MIRSKKNNRDDLKDNKDMENSIKSTADTAEDASESVNGNSASAAEGNNAASSDKTGIDAELEKKVKEIEVLTDTMKRRQADFENYKKRMTKMQEEQKKFAIKDFALEIININDDLLRAFDAACSINREKSVDEVCNTFSEGYLMLSKKIEEALHKYGIDEIDAINKEFDPTCNEAIEIDESGNVGCDTVTKVHQKGFRLDDMVIRPSRVKVTKPKKDIKNDDSGNGEMNAGQTDTVQGNGDS